MCDGVRKAVSVQKLLHGTRCESVVCRLDDSSPIGCSLSASQWTPAEPFTATRRPTAMTYSLLSPSHRRTSRSSITRTVVWVSIAFLLLTLPALAEAQGKH